MLRNPSNSKQSSETSPAPSCGRWDLGSILMVAFVDYFNARHYSSNQGRFMSRHPAGLAAVDPNNPASWNQYAYTRSGLKKPQAGTPVLRRGAFPAVQAPCETVGKGGFPIFETTSGVVVGWRGPQRGEPATAVTAPGRCAARPAYAAAPLEKRGRPAHAGLGARGPKPALRVGRESSRGIEPHCGSRPPCVLANHPVSPLPESGSLVGAGPGAATRPRQ